MKKNATKTKNAVLAWKNVTRGIVGHAKSKTFESKPSNKPVHLALGMQRLLLYAGRNLPTSAFSDFLAWAETQKEMIPRNAQALPAKYSLMSSYYDDEDIDFDRQISWTIARLRSSFDQIYKFFETVSEVERLTLLGHVSRAREMLISLESKYGPSIYMIEARLAIEQLTGGLEAQKKLADKIKGKGKGGLVGFVVHYISMRNEPRTPISRYREVIENRASKMESGSIRDYVEYRLCDRLPPDTDVTARVLRIEESHSIFDVALTTLRIYQSWCVASDPPKEVRKWRESISSCLKNCFPVRYLQSNAAGLSTIEEKLILNVSSGVTSVKSFYREICRDRIKTGEMRLSDLQLIFSLAALIRDNFDINKPGSLFSILRRNVVSCLSYAQQKNAGWDDVEKIAINMRFFDLFHHMSVAIRKEEFNIFDPWRPKVESSAPSLPAAIASLPFPHAEHASLSQHLYSVVQALRWLMTLWQRRNIADMESFSRFVEESTIEKLPRALQINLLLTAVRANVELGEWRKVFAGLASLATIHNVDHRNLPLSAALDGHRWRNIAKYANQIDLSICLELYSRQIADENIEAMKRYAIEDYLASNGVAKPSDMEISSLAEPREKVVYFLRHVCVQRTMELLKELKGSHALDNERRQICSLLLHLDKENAFVYNDEIVSIIHRARIDEGLRLVDSSRVHVDVDMLIKQCANELRTDFERYLGLVGAGVGVASNFDHVLRGISKPNIDEEWLKVPESEADDLLISLIRVVLEKFLFDQQHGLDSYLGRRIRHNSLTGQMRAPLGQANLVTQFDTAAGEYQSNVFWLSKLSRLCEEDLAKLDVLLKNFSRDFDAIGQELRDKYLHIRTSEFPNGIFDISLSAISYHILRSIAQQSETIEAFLSACFARFWGITAGPLALARGLMRGHTQRTVSKVFDQLKVGLSEISEPQLIMDLNAAVSSAQQGVSRQIEKISDWFNRRDNESANKTYSIEDAVNIAIEACLTSHRAVNPNISKVVETDLTVDAASLFALADVFWIAIDNACTHSGYPQNVKIDIRVCWEDVRKALRLTFSNEVAEKARNAVTERNVASIAEDIDKRRHREGLRVEGKSGIKKIASIAYSTTNGRLEFGFREPNSFILDVDIPIFMTGETLGPDESANEESCDACVTG